MRSFDRRGWDEDCQQPIPSHTSHTQHSTAQLTPSTPPYRKSMYERHLSLTAHSTQNTYNHIVHIATPSSPSHRCSVHTISSVTILIALPSSYCSANTSTPKCKHPRRLLPWHRCCSYIACLVIYCILRIAGTLAVVTPSRLVDSP